MEKAKKNVEKIDNKLISELLALKQPSPKLILPLMLLANVCKGTCKKYEWSEIKVIMRGDNFLKTIKQMNGEQLSKECTDFIKLNIKPESGWNIDEIKTASYTVGEMAYWLICMIEFSEKKNSVKPYQDEIDNLNDRKMKVEKEYQVTADEIVTLERKIDILKSNYEKSLVLSNNLKRELEEVKSKVGRSEKLLSVR